VRRTFQALLFACLAPFAGGSAAADSPAAEEWARWMLRGLPGVSVACSPPLENDPAMTVHCVELPMPWKEFRRAWESALRSAGRSFPDTGWPDEGKQMRRRYIVDDVPVDVFREADGPGLAIAVPRFFLDCDDVNWGDAVDLDGDTSGGITSPQLEHRVEAEYPERERLAKRAGKVWMMGLIRTDGHVAPICIKSSEGATPAMKSAALRALAQWRYAPALRDGQPIAVRFVVAISFSVR